MNKHEEVLINLLKEIVEDVELTQLLARKKSFVDAVLYMEHIFIKEKANGTSNNTARSL
jgi:hypothetical protein